MYFSLKNTLDIKREIKRRNVNGFIENHKNLHGSDRFGNKKQYIHVFQSKLKRNRDEDIYVFTDGSRLQEKDEGKISHEIYTYGVYIESQGKDVYTYGIASNLDNKYSFRREDDGTKMIELKAIEDALITLQQNYQNLSNRNVYLYSDNLFNLKDLAVLIKLKLLDKSHEEYADLNKIFFQIKKNKERYALLEKIADFSIKHNINISWIRSHSGYQQNEIVDQLAKHAIIIEKKNHLTNTSRISGVYGLHSFTKIINKKSSPKNTDTLDQVVVSQKFTDGNSELKVKGENISYSHDNSTLVKAKIDNKTTLIVKSDYQYNSKENKRFYQDLTLREIEQNFSEKNQVLLSRINGANFNSMLNFISEYLKRNKQNINLLTHQINTLSTSKLIHQYFFKTIDNNFQDIKPNLKNIFNININYIQPPNNNSVGINRKYTYIKNSQVFYLENHKNDHLFSVLSEGFNFLDKEKLNTFIKKGISEQGEINQLSSLLLEKFRTNQNNFQNSLNLEEDNTYQEIKEKKISINPLMDMQRVRRKI